MFAKRKFLRGEILWITDNFDLKIPLKKYQMIEERQRNILNIYSYMDNKSRVIVPWDEGKYVNHSCSPNATCLLEFDNITVAIKEIDPGEEIVEDYRSYFGHFETFDCNCGSSSCKKKVDCSDSYDPNLRISLFDIVHEIVKHSQPLLSYHTADILTLIKMLERFSSLNGSGLSADKTLLNTTFIPEIPYFSSQI